MTKAISLKGKKVAFHALRIAVGNPVIGVVTIDEGVDGDDTHITVKLDHDIEGLVNAWYAGEEKTFAVGLIEGGRDGITVVK